MCSKFCLFWFVDSLMENVRVRRAGFVFRQEYDVALERYKGFFPLFSQAGGLCLYATLLPKNVQFSDIFLSHFRQITNKLR